MREIKVRGQRRYSEEWNYLNLSEYLTQDSGDVSDLLEYVHKNIGQHTGLKDKNGVDIYESDITKDKYVIMWCEEKALFAEFFQNGYSKEWNIAKYPIDHRSIEIIGNIFDNPELLNK